MTFEELNLHPVLLEGLDAMGFKQPTPIQEQAIPIIMDQKDLIACAQTGTGKTAAFLLPIIHQIVARGQSENRDVNSLIIVPTRELAIQIDQMLQGFAYFTPISSIAMYGGSDGASFAQQKQAFIEGADIVVATPGKLISHLNMGYSKLNHLKYLVLDEADKMLDMGFYDDIVRIIQHLSKERQTLMFSATMPKKIRKLANDILLEHEEINIALSKPAEGITQLAYLVYDQHKTALIRHILKVHQEFKSVIIFSSRKHTVKDLARDLQQEGLSVKEIHSDLDQNTREDIVREFKNEQIRILIGTDVIARGLDVKGIDAVINMEVPNSAEDYVHRVGRTARVSSDGLGYAFTLVNEKEQQDFYQVEKTIGIEVTRFEIPEYIGESPKIQEPRKGGYKGKERSRGGRPRKKNYRRRSNKNK